MLIVRTPVRISFAGGGTEEPELGRRIERLDLLEWHDGLALELAGVPEERAVGREGDDLVLAVVPEIEVSQRGEVPQAEDDDPGHGDGSR